MEIGNITGLGGVGRSSGGDGGGEEEGNGELGLG